MYICILIILYIYVYRVKLTRLCVLYICTIRAGLPVRYLYHTYIHTPYCMYNTYRRATYGYLGDSCFSRPYDSRTYRSSSPAFHLHLPLSLYLLRRPEVTWHFSVISRPKLVSHFGATRVLYSTYSTTNYQAPLHQPSLCYQKQRYTSGINPPGIYIISEDADYQRPDEWPWLESFREDDPTYQIPTPSLRICEGDDYTFSAENSGRRLIMDVPLDC